MVEGVSTRHQKTQTTVCDSKFSDKYETYDIVRVYTFCVLCKNNNGSTQRMKLSSLWTNEDEKTVKQHICDLMSPFLPKDMSHIVIKYMTAENYGYVCVPCSGTIDTRETTAQHYKRTFTLPTPFPEPIE